MHRSAERKRTAYHPSFTNITGRRPPAGVPYVTGDSTESLEDTTTSASAVSAGLERLDDRGSSRCGRAVADRVRQAAGGAAERADVAVEHGARDEATVVLE